MKSLIASLISGAIGAALVSIFFQPSHAEEVSERAKEMLNNGTCEVDVDYGRMTIGSRCYRNEVMVGQDGDYIYCGNIRVTCN